MDILINTGNKAFSADKIIKSSDKYQSFLLFLYLISVIFEGTEVYQLYSSNHFEFFEVK